MLTVEFMGMPNAGKTSGIKATDNVLKHERNKKIARVTESGNRSPLDKDKRFKFNAWAFNDTVNRIMEYQLRDNLDYLLVDKGIYDYAAFTDALFREGILTAEQKEAQESYLRQFKSLEDKVIVLLVEPEVAMGREEKYGSAGGRVINEDFLETLYESYAETISEIDLPKLVLEGPKPIEDEKEKILDFL
ncbi:MAG: hypothetical protein ACLFTQ_00050 [Candidatus Aenigmatarchaeota archaeon]